MGGPFHSLLIGVPTSSLPYLWLLFSHEWLVDPVVLDETKSLDLAYLPPRLLATLGIFFSNLISRMGRKLSLRQLPIATANVLFKRFYLRNSLCESDPFLVAGCCIYVAAKVEETPVHIKTVTAECRSVCVDVGHAHFPAEHTKLAEMEFYLLEDVEFNLVVFHPYRALGAITGKEPVDTGRWPDDQDQTQQQQQHEAGGGGGAGGGGRRKSFKGTRQQQQQQQSSRASDTAPLPLPERRDGEDEMEWYARVLTRGTGRGAGVGEMPEGVPEMAW